MPDTQQSTLERAAVELADLNVMIDELERAPEPFQPSRFWEHFNARNLDQIASDGFGAFKRTVNSNYFQWEPGSPRGDQPRDAVARRLLKLWLRRPDPRIFTARLAHAERSLHAGAGARWHAICVAALWQFARRNDRLGLLDLLREPELGEPPLVRFGRRLVSEDMANSALELATIAEAEALPTAGDLVIELGGGYGRLAWMLLAAVPEIRFVVCDIPPALAIAQRYLTETLPELRAFRFRPFSDPAELRPELDRAQLIFLLPHQLAQLQPLAAKLFINVSSLHEMRTDQIAMWFELIDRHTDGFFYTKQWQRSLNVFDDLVVSRHDYPVPRHWRAVIDRDTAATPDFFEALYRIGSAA